MGKREFRVSADVLPEPMLLVSMEGVIQAANQASVAQFQSVVGIGQGTPLDALFVDASRW